MQLSYFPQGGFVIHAIRHHSFKGRASAWYDPEGKLIDSLVFDSRNRTRKAGANAIPHLKSLGRIHRKS